MHFGAQWGTHIALGVCSWCECTLDGLNAEHKFRVWVTILVHMSHPFTSLHYFAAYCLSDTVVPV